VREWDAQRVADAAGATLHRPARDLAEGPARASIDSRSATAQELFFGLPGERTDGGCYAAHALAGGAWGVLVQPQHLDAALAEPAGAVLSHPNPLAALQALAGAWRIRLGAQVVAITGSTGKTSTKDILAAILQQHLPTAATHANLNTEIGLPLTILAAPAGTRALVLELAMRGAGQIAQLTEIADPDVGVIVNVGAAHLELLGSLEAIAAAKAELVAGMRAGTTAVLPAGEALLEPYLRADLTTVTFGEGGDVALLASHSDGMVEIDAQRRRITLRPSFQQAHQLTNLLAAVAAALALGVTPDGELEVAFTAMRGARLELAGGVVAIDDCYNANPMSMRAAIDDLAATAAGRRVAVLGDMLELGPQSPELHRRLGEQARAGGIEVLLTVGPLAAAARDTFGAQDSVAVPDAEAAAERIGTLVRDGDTVLVKGSRGVGLERVVDALRSRRGQGSD